MKNRHDLFLNESEKILLNLIDSFNSFDFDCYRGKPIDVFKTKNDDGLVYHIAVTGYSKDDIKLDLDVTECILYVKAGCSENKNEDKTYITQRIKSSINYAIHIPKELDMENIEAKCENGLLEIKFKRQAKNVKTVSIG